MQHRLIVSGIFALLLSACLSEEPGAGRSESVMMDGYDVCIDAEGGAGELIQKINNKFFRSVDELAQRTDGPAFAARLSEKNLQQQNAILDVLETSANSCISSPVTPDQLERVRKSRDDAKSSYDGWMATAPELFRDAPEGPSDADVLNFINMLATVANAYTQAQAGVSGSYQPNAGYSGSPGGSSVECGSECVVSDSRLKLDIAPIGITSHGLAIYRFSYVPETGIDGVFIGVMAQDLLATRFADAVFLADSGYLMVDYSKLPIEFVRLE